MCKATPCVHIRHGRFGTPEYAIWNSMVGRCRNPRHQAYGNYGARGIVVCDRWLDFANFYADISNLDLSKPASERTGLCLCGCGQQTSIARKTRNNRGDVAGLPVRYIYGHNAKDPRWRSKITDWTSKTNWSGGRIIHNGYVLRHRRTFKDSELRILGTMFLRYHKNGRYILEHRAIVALREGRELGSNEFVRHLDGNRKNNRNSNLLLGTPKDNTGDHESLRRENIALRSRVAELEHKLKEMEK